MTKSNVLKFVFALMCVITIVTMMYSCQQASRNTSIDLDTIELVQFSEDIADDTPVAVIKTTLGDMKAILYPEYAPNTVQNFTELAQQDYYDNSYIFRIQKGTYFACGSPQPDGNLPDDHDKEREKIANEYHQNLWPFRWSICALNTGMNCSGSRFIVVDSIEFTDEIKEEMLSSSENTILADAFIEHGGIPNYSRQMTVFAQIYDGTDIAELIANQDADEDNELQPYEEILITDIEISTYGEQNNE